MATGIDQRMRHPYISGLLIPVLPVSSDLQELLDKVKTYYYDDQDLESHEKVDQVHAGKLFREGIKKFLRTSSKLIKL